MSSRSLAARFGLILSRNPEIEGLSDAQVQEFLELYAQVTLNSWARTTVCQQGYPHVQENEYEVMLGI